MNWFKRIFYSQEEFVAHIEDPVARKDRFQVKTPRVEKDISEPVLSFIKCVRENPKRFCLIYNYEFKLDYYFSLQDKNTKEGWTLSKGNIQYVCASSWCLTHTTNPEWLTEDEKEYLITSIKTIFHDRRDRKQKLQDIRKQRRIRDERNRLKEIYK